MTRSRLTTLVLVLAVAALGYLGIDVRDPVADNPGPAAGAHVETRTGSQAGSGTIVESQLPPQAVATLQRIRQGGPFPYEKDGTVFGNREKRLPIQKHGYYLEYTVKTPGVSHRGARRIVAGGPARDPVALYYTQDHYETFRQIIEDVR